MRGARWGIMEGAKGAERILLMRVYIIIMYAR
jgi:hypothetical protein